MKTRKCSRWREWPLFRICEWPISASTNGYDLHKLPLFERKTHLKKLIAGTAIQFSDSLDVDSAEMFAHVCGLGLEGVVSKVRDSRYPPAAAMTG